MNEFIELKTSEAKIADVINKKKLIENYANDLE